MTNVIVWWLTCLIWSSVWLFIKIGVSDVPPVSFAAIRLLLALAVLLPIAAARRVPVPQSRDWTTVAVTGMLLLALNYASTFWGAQFVSSGIVAVLQAATPAFGLCFGHYLLPDERFSLKKLGVLALGIIGVAIICGDRLQTGGAPGLAGAASVVFGGVCVALGYVLVKAHGSHLDPLAIMTGQIACAVVPLVAYGLIHDGNPLAFRWTTRAVGSLLYLALAGSVAAFWLNYWLLQRLGATKVLSMSLVEPLIAVVLGALVLHETITLMAGVGGILILISIWLLLTAPAGDGAGG
jgi:drug/metabolite transporter (DMT)-like permease